MPHYACLDSKRRGKAICINRVALRQDLLDRAILGGDRRCPRSRGAHRRGGEGARAAGEAPARHIERRAQVERELAQVQQRLDRLVDALADGSLPADEIKARLSAEKARKTALIDGLRKARAGGEGRESCNVEQIARSSAPASAT